MATYVMSDIHGEYAKYRAMLETIAFSDDDVLYVLGDVIDRGDEPLKILLDMSLRHNVFPLLGNHELMARDVLDALLAEVREDNYDTQLSDDLLEQLSEWQENGGDVTLSRFYALSGDDRLALYDYLKEFALYAVVDIGDNTFILSHTGHISADKRLSEHTELELTCLRSDYERVFTDDTVYLISGHTPTFALTGKAEIFRCNHHINIDCGATFGGKLACLRLDDLAEFYV